MLDELDVIQAASPDRITEAFLPTATEVIVDLTTFPCIR